MATTPGTIKHRKQSTLPTGSSDIDVPQWNDSEVVAGGTNGDALVRDSTQADGWGWSPLSIYPLTVTGSWTPVLGGSGGASGVTYSSRFGLYTKIGPMVYANFELFVTNKGTITGNVQIQGLPVPSITGGSFPYSCILRFANMTTNWITIICILGPASTAGYLQGCAAAATNNATNLAAADLSNTTYLSGMLVYVAA